MGSEITVYNLYELYEGREKFLFLKATRPSFSNVDVGSKYVTYEKVDLIFKAMIADQQSRLGFVNTKLIGTWEDGYPDNIFYSANSNIPLKVWLAFENKYNEFFVFGITETEKDFWNFLQELYIDGDLWGFDEFIRPAILQRVWFVQQSLSLKERLKKKWLKIKIRW